MSRDIRWGIISTGEVADTFAADLATTPAAMPYAVASRTAESAANFARRHAIAHAYGSWQELADDPAVDIIYIATPHHAHYDAAWLSLHAGKPVLCEKPFTLNAAQAQQLTDLAQARGLFLMEAMWMRTNPAIRRTAQLIADGAIGQPRTVHADFGLAGPLAPTHRLRNPALGGGALLDLGVYPVSLAHLILGVPQAITATTRLTDQGVDADTHIVLGYHHGAVAFLSCSIDTATPCTATITGSRGHITLPSPFFRPNRLVLHRAGTKPQEIVIPFQGNGYVHEIEEAVRCLNARLIQSPLVSWQDTSDVMCILDRVRTQIGVHYPGEPTTPRSDPRRDTNTAHHTTGVNP